jgi:hypothetical protein
MSEEGALYMRSGRKVYIDDKFMRVDDFDFQFGEIHKLSAQPAINGVFVKILSLVGETVLMEFSPSQEPW